MKIKYYAHSCFSITYNDGTVFVTDPYDESVTYPPCNASCTAALVSHDHFDHNHIQSLSGCFETVCTAGTFDFGKIRVTATESFHDKEKGALRGKNLLFRMEGEGLAVAHMGDLGHMLNSDQQSALEDLDVLMIPIGGTYTIDYKEAEEIIKVLKPRVTIAMHFQTPEYGDCFVTPDQFKADTGAVDMPREIEITAENIKDMPSVIIMAHN